MSASVGSSLSKNKWLHRWATDSATQIGIAGASWSVAGTAGRGHRRNGSHPLRTHRERQWATKRTVARKLDRTRKSIEKQLAQWGEAFPIELADLDPTQDRMTRPCFGTISGPPGS